VNSWGENLKSPWQAGFLTIVICGLIALFVMWLVDASVFLMILAGFLLAVLAWFLYFKHKDWEKERLNTFYEEELLKLKLTK